MKKLYKKMCLIMLAVCVPAVISAQNGEMTLSRYIQRVLDHNKDIKLAVKDKELADIQKKQATASALPAVGMQGSYNRNLTEYYMYFDMSAFNPAAIGYAKAPIKRDNEFGVNVALQQTLFSPTVGSAIKASKQYTELTSDVFEATRNGVITGAKKLFHQCLLLEKVRDVAGASEKNASENYNQMKLKFDNGQVSKFKLLQAETRWRSAVPETQKAERNLKLAMNALRHMAGISVQEQVVLKGDLTHIPDMPSKPDKEKIMQSRPDFRALGWELKLRETNVGAAKGSFLPTVKGTLAWAYSAQSDEFVLDQENKLWFAGVSVSVPLCTGGYRPAMVQKAKAELAKTRLNIEKARESIETELAGVELRLKEARQRIESAKAVLHTAEQGFKIAETTAKNGLATQLQLKDARIGYDSAVVNFYAAVYDYLDACFDWDMATGNVEF